MSTETLKLQQAKKLLEQKRYREAIAVIDSFLPGESLLEQAEVCLLRTEAMLALGDYSSHFVDKALNILKPTDNLKAFALAKYFKARIQVIAGELVDAQENLTEAYVYYKRQDDLRGMGRIANEQALISASQSDFISFRRYAEMSLDCYRRNGNSEQVGMVLSNVAISEALRGCFNSAQSYLTEIQNAFLQHLNVSYKYNFYHFGAILFSQRNLNGHALKMLEMAEALPKELTRERCRHYEISGYVHMLCGDYAKAKKLLLQGIELANTMVEPVKALYSQIYRLLGDLHVLTDEWKTAEKYADDALKIAVEINERLEIAACYRIIAQVAQHHGDENKARENFKEAIDLFNKIDARYELAVTRYLAAASKLYSEGERNAMLYLAREYFVSEDVHHYAEKVDKELKKVPFHIPKVAHSGNGCPKIVAVSPKMKKIVALAEHVANSEMTVLLTGATGTGKDLLARYIHHCNGRTGEFVSVNSAAIPHEMIESELFGYKKGAFTGAADERPGLFEQAEGGTFYLNEIADATLSFQAKLLEVLETRQVRRLGENKMRPVSFRLIAATNHDLVERIRENKFRADLYHRLKQIPIHLPSLSERLEDIAPMVEQFLKSLGCTGSTAEIGGLLAKCPWPGNVRELQLEVSHLWLMSGGNLEKMAELMFSTDDESERKQLMSALDATGWNRRETARQLNISEATVRYRMKKFGILEPVLS